MTIVITSGTFLSLAVLFLVIEFGEDILAGLWFLCKWLVPTALVGGLVYFVFGSIINFPVEIISLVAIGGFIAYIRNLYKKAGYL